MSSARREPPRPAGEGDDEERPLDFDRFFAETRPSLLALAITMCGNLQDAEDAVQDAFLEAARKWDEVGTFAYPKAWTRTVMERKLWRTARWHLLARRVPLELPSPRQASVAGTARARAVLAAMGALPPRQRQVMAMFTLNSMPAQEIAESLEIDASTVRANVRKGRGNLIRMLGLDRDDLTGEVQLTDNVGPVPRDRLAAALSATESWLRDAIREDEAGLRRARADLADVARHEGDRGDGRAAVRRTGRAARGRG